MEDTYHEKNRAKVCAVCGRKIKYGSIAQSKFCITERIENLIKVHCNCQFSLKDPRFPTYRSGLTEREKGNFARHLPQTPNFMDNNLPMKTCCKTASKCDCYICVTGSIKYHEKVIVGKGRKKEPKSVFKPNLHPEEDQVLQSNTSQSLIICRICQSEKGKGKSHTCNVSNTHKNILKRVTTLPQIQKDHLISSLLNEKTMQNNRNNEVEISTGGSKMRVTVNQKESKPIKFSEEHLDNYINNTGKLF